MSLALTRPPLGIENGDLAQWLEEVERQLNLVGSRTLDVGSIAAGTVTTFTISVIGCRTGKGQAVAIAAPPALEASLMWSGAVTADDVVTVRLYNPTAGAIDPVSATWGARVLR